MNWSDIVGHSIQKELLKGSMRRGRIAHTYLFVGPRGIGKGLFARMFTQSLLCEEFRHRELEVCNRCPGCKQVIAGTHPDVFFISCPEGKREIPVDLLLGPPEKRGKMGLCYDLSHTPMAGGRKVAIIDDAEMLNETGANALLKTLEEPPPHSVIVLISSSMDAVLPTIRSRCQVLRFNPLPDSQVAEILLQTKSTVDPQQAALAAASSEGSVQIAVSLLAEEAIQLRNRFFDQLSARQYDSLKTTAFVQQSVEGAGTDAPSQRDQANWFFRNGIEFFRSVIGCVAADVTPLISQAGSFSQRLPANSPDHISGVTHIIERFILASTHLDQNVGVPLTIETLFDDLGRLLRSLPAR